jgi:hypothetical protein
MVFTLIGVPGGIRTHGPRIRNPVLYPAELRGRISESAFIAGSARMLEGPFIGGIPPINQFPAALSFFAD